MQGEAERLAAAVGWSCGGYWRARAVLDATDDAQPSSSFSSTAFRCRMPGAGGGGLSVMAAR